MMNRRNFFKAFGASVASVAVGAVVQPQPEQDRQPIVYSVEVVSSTENDRAELMALISYLNAVHTN